jgi:hypothetical protein
MSNRETISRVLLHRLRTHRAALANAAALDYPMTLAGHVRETRARLDEALIIGAELLGDDAPLGDVADGERTPAYGFQCDGDDE